MRLITLHLPLPYIKALDKLVDEKFYPNRAEAMRVAIRDLLNEEAWGVPTEKSALVALLRRRLEEIHKRIGELEKEGWILHKIERGKLSSNFRSVRFLLKHSEENPTKE